MAEKGVQVSATIPREWDAKLEDHRWTVRMTKTQLVRAAVEEYMVKHGLITDPEGIVEESDTTA